MIIPVAFTPNEANQLAGTNNPAWNCNNYYRRFGGYSSDPGYNILFPYGSGSGMDPVPIQSRFIAPCTPVARYDPVRAYGKNQMFPCGDSNDVLMFSQFHGSYGYTYDSVFRPATLFPAYLKMVFPSMPIPSTNPMHLIMSKLVSLSPIVCRSINNYQLYDGIGINKHYIPSFRVETNLATDLSFVDGENTRYIRVGLDGNLSIQIYQRCIINSSDPINHFLNQNNDACVALILIPVWVHSNILYDSWQYNFVFAVQISSPIWGALAPNDVVNTYSFVGVYGQTLNGIDNGFNSTLSVPVQWGYNNSYMGSI